MNRNSRIGMAVVIALFAAGIVAGLQGVGNALTVAMVSASGPPCANCEFSGDVTLPNITACDSNVHEVVLIELDRSLAVNGNYVAQACFVDTSTSTDRIVSCLKDIDTTVDTTQARRVVLLVAPEGENPDTVRLYHCSGTGTIGVLTSYDYCLDCGGDITDPCDSINCSDQVNAEIFGSSCVCGSGGSCGGTTPVSWQKAEVALANDDSAPGSITVTYWWSYKEHCQRYDDTSTVTVTIDPDHCTTATKWVPIFNANYDGVMKLNYIVRSGDPQYLFTSHWTSCASSYGGTTTSNPYCTGTHCP